MKKNLYFLLLLAFSFGAIKMQAAHELKRYFELQGKIFQTGFDAKGTARYLDSAMILVKNEMTEETDTLFSAESGEYIFQLPLNNSFLVTVRCDSFLSKTIHINTHVPLFTTGYYGMEFELSLYKMIPGLPVSFLDKPVAEVAYDAKKKTFDYNHAYSDQVNRDLKKIYTAYYLHKPIPAVASNKTIVVKSDAKRKTAKAIRISGRR